MNFSNLPKLSNFPILPILLHLPQKNKRGLTLRFGGEFSEFKEFNEFSVLGN